MDNDGLMSINPERGYRGSPDQSGALIFACLARVRASREASRLARPAESSPMDNKER